MTLRGRVEILILLFAAIACCALPGGDTYAQANESDNPVRKINPLTRELLPVEPGKIIPGKIYKHFSPAHNRYVWAYAVEDGGFSYAFGPGTTEFPANFDLATSAAQTEQLLESEAGAAWTKSVRQGEGKFMVRLTPEDRWEVLRFASIRSHFDLDTGQRWEWQGGRKVAVLNTNGYEWKFADGWYVPANPWLPATCALCGSHAHDCCGE